MLELLISSPLLQSVFVTLLLLCVICVALSVYFFFAYQRNKTLLDDSPAAQFLIGCRSGDIHYANALSCELLTLRKSAYVWDFCHAELGLQLLDILNPHAQQEHVQGVYWEFESEGVKHTLQLFARRQRVKREWCWLVNAYRAEQQLATLRELRAQCALLNDVLNSVPEFIYFKDHQAQLLGANSAWSALHGQSPEDLRGKNLSDLLSPEELYQAQRFDKQVLEGEVCQQTEWYTAADAQQILLQHNYYPLRNLKNELTGVLCVAYDVTHWQRLNRQLERENTQRLNSERELSRQNSLIRTVLKSSPDPLGFFDKDGCLMGGNDLFAQMFGVSSDELQGRHLTEFVAQSDVQLHLLQNQQVLATNQPLLYEEQRADANGQTHWFEVIKAPFNDRISGESGVIYMTRDVTERKLTEDRLAKAVVQLEELSFVDSLTQVANRRSFDQQLEQLWAQHCRDEGVLSLLLIDVDAFKQYNDHYGHQQGDQALCLIANIVRRAVKRRTDVVARYGGEEFAVLLPNTGAVGAENIAQHLLKDMRKAALPHHYSNVAEHLTISIGVATLYPSADNVFGDLITLADQRLYLAKGQGRARYCASGENAFCPIDDEGFELKADSLAHSL